MKEKFEDTEGVIRNMYLSKKN